MGFQKCEEKREAISKCLHLTFKNNFNQPQAHVQIFRTTKSMIRKKLTGEGAFFLSCTNGIHSEIFTLQTRSMRVSLLFTCVVCNGILEYMVFATFNRFGTSKNS